MKLTYENRCFTTSKEKNIIRLTGSNRRSFVRLVNGQKTELVIIHYDGCCLTGSPAADYVVECSKTSRALIVELKGRHVDHALRQILATIEREYHGLNYELAALVKASKVPAASSDNQRLLKNLSRFGIRAKVSSSVSDFYFDDLFN